MTSSVHGFWRGWPAGAWTADIPPTPASSPMSATSPIGLTRSRSAHPSLSPWPLLLTPRFHPSLCRLLARLGLAQPLCLQRPGPCCCLCSGSRGRPGADPPSSCAPVSASDSSLHLANSHPSPTSSISFPGPHLGLPVQQWPPHKPSLQSPITKGKSPPAAALGPYGPSCRPSFLLLLGSSI